MTPHIKHIIITVIVVVGLAGGAIAYATIQGHYDYWKAREIADRDKQVSANQVKAAELQKGAQSDHDAITARDLQNAKDTAELRARLNQALTPAQAQALFAQMLSGISATQGKDTQGNATSTFSTLELASKLNNLQVNSAICDRNFSTCEADKANLNQAIGKLNEANSANQATIELQQKDIRDLSKNQVPRHMLFFGVGKAQGTNFQDVNSYQPVIGYGYRLTNRFGLAGFAQNKSVAIGGTWNFGGTK